VLGATIIGLIIAAGLTALRFSRLRLLSAFSVAYSLVFRGTPLLVTIFMIYYGLGQFQVIRQSIAWLVLRDAHACALLALSLVTAAYVSEFLTGALRSVPRGLSEAAQSLGLGRFQRFALVVLPAALPLIVPLYINEIILLLKGSALVSTITVIDLAGAANLIYLRTYNPFFPFLAAGAFYLTMSTAVGLVGAQIEKHLITSDR
jgi:His/Glu/Gln/Arg/opine family amino acid ABC transporter permease subunit